MQIGGISIVEILGIVNFLLVVFQMLTGLHIVKVRFGIHKKSGIVLCITACIHGVLAFFPIM